MPSGNILDPVLNPDWTNEGSKNTRFIHEVLGKGQSYCTEMLITFNEDEQNISFTNDFSVTEILDVVGQPVGNILDCAGSPNGIITSITPNIFDLALKHELAVDQIYSFGSEVKINTTVYNQGNTPATSFTVVNYLNEEFDFDPDKNTGWELSGDARFLTYKVKDVLYPGENSSIMLFLVLKSRCYSRWYHQLCRNHGWSR